jgi:hypothetical protein
MQIEYLHLDLVFSTKQMEPSQYPWWFSNVKQVAYMCKEGQHRHLAFTFVVKDCMLGVNLRREGLHALEASSPF